MQIFLSGYFNKHDKDHVHHCILCMYNKRRHSAGIPMAKNFGKTVPSVLDEPCVFNSRLGFLIRYNPNVPWIGLIIPENLVKISQGVLELMARRFSKCCLAVILDFQSG